MASPETIDNQISQLLSPLPDIGSDTDDLDRNQGSLDLTPPTLAEEMDYDLKEKLMFAGEVLGALTGGVIANLVFDTDLPNRIVFITPLAVLIGAILGAGHAFVISEIISLRSKNLTH